MCNKMKKLLLISILLTIVGGIHADNLKVADFELTAGEEKAIDIELINPDKMYVAFQFDLVLPEGVSIAKNKENKLIVSLDEDRLDDHSLSVEDIGSNTYRFISFSLTNAEYYEQSGALVHLTVKGADNITEGAKTATITGQTFTEKSGTQHNFSDVTFKITVPSAVVPKIQADNKSRKYGEENPQLTYQVTEGELTGVPELTTTATMTSPVGDYPIVVNKGTIEGNYEATNGTLTITKASLNIAAGTYYKKQGEAMPEFTLTYTGFKNNETKNVLTKQAVVSCDATVESAPGEYPVTVSGAEAVNYDISYTAGKLVVTEADLVTIKAKSYSRKYGEANPNFEFTTEGAALIGTPQITCEATATSPVGEYPIVVTKGTVSNYNVSYVAGTLTITKASLNIAAGTYKKKQGEAMPEFTLTYTGFKNNETKNVLTKQAVVSCDATVESAPGEYPVTVSGAEAVNYDISYTAGKLIIETATGIATLKDVPVMKAYDMNGLQLSKPQRGLNIVRMSDGTTRKVVIK